MTATTLHAPTGLVTRDGEGHGNVYAKEPRMEYASATELTTGEGLLRAIGL